MEGANCYNEFPDTKIKLIFERGIDCVSNNYIPENDLEEVDFNILLPKELQRESINIPNVPEVEIIRHYIGLSHKNYGVDNGIYPLGSCTMKYNPKINEFTARLMEFASVHPLQEENEGSLELIDNLCLTLSEICGMDAFTTNPAAGAHGEFTGLLLMKKYFEEKGLKKDKIIVPDSSHGTNPASASMVGYSIIELKSDENGELPLKELEFAMKGGDVAGLMLTNPNTLGLFDRNILKITEIVHKYGGLCYYDGANLNPILGICRPGDMGFDIIHVNLHKTFSTPHGGGGPGAGPVGVKKVLIPYLPIPRVVLSDSKYKILFGSEDSPQSIGRIRSYWGNFGILVRAYTYILALGGDGLRRAGQISVLNANYMRVLLQKKFNLPYNRICCHEFVLSDKGLPNDINTEDIAKRILDFGLYTPTIYFPLIVHGAMMFEPTETQTKESLDEYINIMMQIYEEAKSDPSLLKNAPARTPVCRLDATLAARKPHLND
jgi:glycine cleavage system P protein (glycine dehydrogenase) subunit 2